MAKKTIMVVDDEPDTIELAKTILDMNGFNAATFSNANDAMAALKKGKIPDLILLDMRMPIISGPDFCKKIKEDPKLKKIKIVFFTASSTPDKSLIEKNGALGFIFKPFDNDKLIEQIKDYLKK